MEKDFHEKWMLRCLELSKLGKGSVSPNPLVGALLLCDNEVVAENYHQKFGEGHAEARVIADVVAKFGEEKARELLKKCTLYVTLEPCSHQGKTPPCANLIVNYEIPRVVIALGDPTKKVDGKGISLLRQSGVEVLIGVCQQEAAWINRRFLVHSSQQRPYIILKWAQTQNGYFAPISGEQKWITGPVSKALSHRWRAEEDAILIGKGTAMADNPALTVREWVGRNPKRILIDRNLDVPANFEIFSDEADTIVMNAIKTYRQNQVTWIDIEQFNFYLPQKIAYQLYLLDVQSLIVEGGAQILKMFIDAGMYDEIRVLQAPFDWENGVLAPDLPRDSKLVRKFSAGEDVVSVFKKENL